MQKDILENFQKLSQMSLENFKKIGETNLRIGEKLLQEQIELTNALIEAASEKADSVSDAKDLKDVASWQTELAQECTKKIVDSSRTCADIVAEAGKVYTSLFESSLKSAGESVSKTSAAKNRKAA